MEHTAQPMNKTSTPQANNGVPFIEKIGDMPDGYVLSREGGEFPIADEWRSSVIVIRAGVAHYLIVSEAEYTSFHRMYEVKRRMMEKGFTNIRIMKAREEVIRIYYEERVEQQNAMRGAVEGGQTKVEELANEIIAAAVDYAASDIHIEARGNRANIFFRVNGTRVFHTEITAQMARDIGSVLYSVHADADSKSSSWMPSQVMDSSIEWPFTNTPTHQLRFSSSPIHPSGGFHIVIRILSMQASGKDINALGYSNNHLSMFDIMVSGSSGMVIICGPTNSGKSTSLQALMGMIYRKRGDTIKMLTVEDPVEYIIPGACQISVPRGRKMLEDNHTKSNFTTFLRGTLRQDPDVVMVGEIRDHDSAAVVKDLVLAGRKIMTTLHTFSALGAYMRLSQIGINWDVMTMPDFISGIVYQRLVPVLCPDCSIPLLSGGSERISKECLYRIQQVCDLHSDNIRVRGDGCSKCNNEGIIGQTVCAEFVMPDRALLRHLANKDLLAAEKYWRDAAVGANPNGGVSALSHAIGKMTQGILSPIDVEDRIALLTADMVTADSMISNSELQVLAGTGRSFSL